MAAQVGVWLLLDWMALEIMTSLLLLLSLVANYSPPCTPHWMNHTETSFFRPCPVQEAAESKWSYVAFAKAYPSAQLGSET